MVWIDIINWIVGLVSNIIPSIDKFKKEKNILKLVINNLSLRDGKLNLYISLYNCGKEKRGIKEISLWRLIDESSNNIYPLKWNFPLENNDSIDIKKTLSFSNYKEDLPKERINLKFIVVDYDNRIFYKDAYIEFMTFENNTKKLIGYSPIAIDDSLIEIKDKKEKRKYFNLLGPQIEYGGFAIHSHSKKIIRKA